MTKTFRLLPVFIYFLTSCTFNDQIDRANNTCEAEYKSGKLKSATALMNCFTSHERPVFAEYYPKVLNDFDEYRIKVAELATELDRHEIINTQFQMLADKEIIPLDTAIRQHYPNARYKEEIKEILQVTAEVAIVAAVVVVVVALAAKGHGGGGLNFGGGGGSGGNAGNSPPKQIILGSYHGE